MKALVVYFSLSGRTKKVAAAIAASLGDASVDVEAIVFKGKMKEFMNIQDAILKGDMARFETNEKIFDARPYDLIVIGAPVYGGRPAVVLNAYVGKIKNLDGKAVVIFGTCRFYPGKSLTVMQDLVKAKGGSVVDQVMFKNFFKIDTKKASAFGQSIKDKLK